MTVAFGKSVMARTTKVQRERLAASALLAAVILTILVINPVGFMGGPRDDGRYLEAARCWAAHGPCLPENHWQGRWPIFVPTAFLIGLLGESRMIVQIWPLICSTAALFLLAKVGARVFDLRIGTVAAILLAITPAFAVQFLRPNVETLELALVLAAVLIVFRWQDDGTAVWPFAAGLMFGLAFQLRETSIAAAVITLGAMFVVGRRPGLLHLAIAAAGFAFPLMLEFATYYQATGDPFFRRRLSLSHVSIPSSELPAWVRHSGSPILNANYIANWHRPMGIHVHWLIDGPLNLLLSPGSGLSLLLAPMLLIAGKNFLPRRDVIVVAQLLGLAAVYVILLTYVFAVDPKPRIMVVALAFGSVALSAILVGIFRSGRKVLALIPAMAIALSGLTMIALMVRMGLADRQASNWGRQYPNAIETNRSTRSMLTLNPYVRAMPELGTGRPYALILSDVGCKAWIGRYPSVSTGMVVTDERPLIVFPGLNRPVTTLCLFENERSKLPD